MMKSLALSRFPFVTCLLIGALLLFGSLGMQNMAFAQSNEVLKGIDVSYCQGGNITWSAVHDSGIVFAFVKASEGDLRGNQIIDRDFKRNMDGAHTAHVLVGPYHLGHPEYKKNGLYNTAESEARLFLNAAGAYLRGIREGILRPALDIEATTVEQLVRDKGREDAKKYLASWIHKWMGIVEEEIHVRPILYVNSNSTLHYLDSSLTKYPLWIAHYKCNLNESPNAGIWGNKWDFWQYYDPKHCGRNVVPGIENSVDLDVFNGDMRRLRNFVIPSSPSLPSPPSLPPTATVLVMDVSGSMGQRWKGGVKIESAKQAALEFIEQVTHEAQTRGGQHQIGVVAFSDGARLLLPLTSDYSRAKQVIISLHATNWTNVGAGLTTAISELNKVRSNAQRFIILLSDGNTNRGLSRDQILNGPVVEARQKKICIHTVAFGDPGDIDANFLRKVGIGSGCGSYSHAETAFELFSTYLKLRHKSLGQVVGEYSSIGKRVTILPGVPISLGTVLIGSGKRELHYTLAWSEQGRLQIRLKDPSGTLVSTSYPGVQIYTTDQFAHLTLLSPKSGAWTVEAAAGTSMPNGTEYYAVLSTRPGGIAIPLPLPIFTIGDRTFGLPSGLPTWLLVTISVTLIALVLYKEFIK
jgi:lysozyme